jgi:N6-adenosine-specific RNA methylase IME4
MTDAERQRRRRARLKRERSIAKGVSKRARRDAREAAMAERIRIAADQITSAPLYGVIYADPPWRFEPWSRETGMDRAADNHYGTMTTEDIKALRIPAAKDCVLFLWVTVPMLPQGLAVVSAWGFTYKSAYFWFKPGPGHGYWSQRDQVEVLLVGTRGNVPAPAPGTQPPQLITAPRGQHSAKPVAFGEAIERLYRSVRRLEMFARSAREGWDVWGAEVVGRREDEA